MKNPNQAPIKDVEPKTSYERQYTLMRLETGLGIPAGHGDFIATEVVGGRELATLTADQWWLDDVRSHELKVDLKHPAVKGVKELERVEATEQETHLIFNRKAKNLGDDELYTVVAEQVGKHLEQSTDNSVVHVKEVVSDGRTQYKLFTERVNARGVSIDEEKPQALSISEEDIPIQYWDKNCNVESKVVDSGLFAELGSLFQSKVDKTKEVLRGAVSSESNDNTLDKSALDLLKSGIKEGYSAVGMMRNITKIDATTDCLKSMSEWIDIIQ